MPSEAQFFVGERQVDQPIDVKVVKIDRGILLGGWEEHSGKPSNATDLVVSAGIVRPFCLPLSEGGPRHAQRALPLACGNELQRFASGR